MKFFKCIFIGNITSLFINGRNYCQDEFVNNNDEVLEMVACGAVDYNMYVVINIGEIVNCTLAQVMGKHKVIVK